PLRELRSRLPQVAGQPPRRFFSERHHPLLAALPANTNEFLLEVDVGEVEVDGLAAAQSRRVDELDERPVAERERAVAVERLERRLDLLAFRGIRQSSRPARAERGVGNVRRAEREAQERAHGGETPRDRRGRELLSRAPELGRILGQLADANAVELRRAPVEPGGEVLQVNSVRTARSVRE